MTKHRDDFAWLVEAFSGRRPRPRPTRMADARRFETVDELVERRARRRQRTRAVLMLIIFLTQ